VQELEIGKLCPKSPSPILYTHFGESDQAEWFACVVMYWLNCIQEASDLAPLLLRRFWMQTNRGER